MTMKPAERRCRSRAPALRRGAVAALLSLSAALAAPRATAQADDPPERVTFGVGVGPTAAWLTHSTKGIFGVVTAVDLSLELSPVVDFRMGISGDAAGSRTSYMSVGCPVGLRLNLTRWYAVAIGAAAGFLSDTGSIAFYAGPEISAASVRFGPERQFELELKQGFHFHAGRAGNQPDLGHIESSLVLAYVFPEPAAWSSARRSLPPRLGLGLRAPGGARVAGAGAAYSMH
jgi:hypothetical protein